MTYFTVRKLGRPPRSQFRVRLNIEVLNRACMQFHRCARSDEDETRRDERPSLDRPLAAFLQLGLSHHIYLFQEEVSRSLSLSLRYYYHSIIGSARRSFRSFDNSNENLRLGRL